MLRKRTLLENNQQQKSGLKTLLKNVNNKNFIPKTIPRLRKKLIVNSIAQDDSTTAQNKKKWDEHQDKYLKGMKEVLLSQGQHETKKLVKQHMETLIEKASEIVQSLIVFFIDRDNLTLATKKINYYGCLCALIYIVKGFEMDHRYR